MSELKKGFYLVTADGINTMLRWDGEDWVDMRGIRPCFKEVVQTRYCGENNPVFKWVGLNWDDVPEIYVGDAAFLHGAQWAEAKLKEKNFGE